MHDPGDEELARRVSEHDKTAFTELYDRYSRSVYALAVHMLGSTEAEETVQEIFIRLWNKADQFDSTRGSFGAWFMATARHRILDKLRTQNRQQRIVVGEAIDELLSNAADGSVSVEEQAWLHLQSSAILSALNELPVEQRQVIVLAYFGGLSQSVMAEHLGLPLGTVKKRVQLGMNKLRTALERQGIKAQE
jgi:RNA polymerase sigma-70 factor, ECF subfamily